MQAGTVYGNGQREPQMKWLWHQALPYDHQDWEIRRPEVKAEMAYCVGKSSPQLCGEGGGEGRPGQHRSGAWISRSRHKHKPAFLLHESTQPSTQQHFCRASECGNVVAIEVQAAIFEAIRSQSMVL